MPQAPSPSIISAQIRSDGNQITQEDIEIDISVNSVDKFGGANDAGQQLLGSSVGWSNMDDIHPLESLEQHIDWEMLDPCYNWSSGTNPPIGQNLVEVPSVSSTSTANHTLTAEEQSSLLRLGLFPFVTSASATDLISQNQLLHSQGCQCRAALAMLIPKVRAALQERRLDGVYQMTDDLIRRCQEIIHCMDCNVNCTDLIWIMTNFQEADSCFECIANSDIEKGAIRIRFGSYTTAVEEQETGPWRRILVSQFVKRANDLLDSISGRGQDMLKELDPACQLGRVNIDYLEAVIRNSKENLRRIMKGLREEVITVE